MAFQDFDLISQRRQQERQKKIRRRITIAVVSTFVVLLIAGAAVCAVVYQKNQSVATEGNASRPGPSSAKPAVNVAEKAVKSVCASTDYVKTCEDSLLKSVKNNASAQPLDILRAAFSVASEEIDDVIKQASDLKFEGPFKKAAFDDCLELLHDAKDELNSSISSIKGKDLDHMSSLKPELNNWLSAVMSYQQTCIDGFPDGPEKDSMKKLLKTVRELGSNALAIVSQVSSIFSAFHAPNAHRRLMAIDEAGYPTWMDHEHRRMLKADATKFTPNVTVAKDGSGDFKTINEALNAMPEKYTGRYVIYVKEGVYAESVIVTKKMVNVTMYGDGSQKSIITGSKNFVDGVPTFQTATFAALGEGFLAQSLGFRNTAGPEKHQAVALRVQSDRSIFINCRMEGYQDTLYAQTHRQFYRSCYITGTVDFIFGDAASVFQNCLIYVRKPMDNQQNIVTAQGRLDKRETTGIVIQNCKILADDKLEPEKAKFRSYLGRPWKEYSRTVIMESEIGDFIHPEGWMEWEGDFALATLYYAEFGNKGAGSGTGGRVKWAGYKTIKKDEATKFTVGPFLQGEAWLKNPDFPVRFGMFT
ncbi:probable pectinesterase/pectinesterase inhibitor 13 [Phtheirospermum japonicum]|uniref:Pectinesterase n=1 Tax=Phtheirospermum japonicum TaxID=374723 RepID=A0A830B8E0_9LAMI|nr:probable pectinesterase/pectinesterase inhibitor 13 [Phtheirospermum japonicum]